MLKSSRTLREDFPQICSSKLRGFFLQLFSLSSSRDHHFQTKTGKEYWNISNHRWLGKEKTVDFNLGSLWCSESIMAIVFRVCRWKFLWGWCVFGFFLCEIQFHSAEKSKTKYLDIGILISHHNCLSGSSFRRIC